MRRSRGQILFATIAIIVVLSMVGSVVASIAIDLAGPGSRRTPDAENARAFEEQQQELIDEQLSRVEANPNDAAAMVLLAQYYQLAQQPEESIVWFERALSINPNDLATRLDFADMLAQAGYQSDAELQYFRVLEIDPVNVPAIFYLGELYQYWQPTARTPEAIAQFQRVIETSPTSTLATTAGERLTLLGAAVPEGTPGAGTPVSGTPVSGAVGGATPIATPVS